MHTKKFKSNFKFLFQREILDYELLDFGSGRKLERFGEIILDRPAIESMHLAPKLKEPWQKTNWKFVEKGAKDGSWISINPSNKEWQVGLNNDLNFELKLTKFKHIGLFPEQSENWQFVMDHLQKSGPKQKVLNLFAYTGAATIVAAKAGADVTNVDSVKQMSKWAKNNADLNGLDSIKWITEDARKYVQRAIRRNEIYNGIIMDPPIFGYGSKGEKWMLEKDLAPLVEDCMKLLAPKKSFFILNTYSPKMSLEKLCATLQNIPSFPKSFEAVYLGLKSTNNQNLPLGNLVRFKRY